MPAERFKMGLGFRLLDNADPSGCILGLRGEGCVPHSSANLWRLGLIGLFAADSVGLEVKGKLVASFASGDDLWLSRCVVSTGTGANLRLDFVVVSTGSGANLRFVFVVVSIGSTANLRFVFTLVSTGSATNFRWGLPVGISSAFLSFEEDVDVSIGSTLKRLGGAADAIVNICSCVFLDLCVLLQFG